MPLMPSPTLDMETLHRYVDSAPEAYQTVQTFLEKYIFPENLEPVFDHDSHSIQHGDASFPRVFLVTPDRRLTLSFIGKPGASGWEAIEVLSVDPNAIPRFQFAELVFPRDLNGSGNHGGGSQRPSWNGYGTVERRCGMCHGGDADGLQPVLPTSAAQDQGVWGGTPAPWPQVLSSSWTDFSTGIQSSSRYAPLRSWIEGATEQQMSAITQDYLSKLSGWMNESR